MTAEEAVILEVEEKAALFEMGELFPDPGEVVIPADLTEQLLFEKNGAKITATKEAEAAAAEMRSPEEDTRQEWEKPLAEIKAEHAGRYPAGEKQGTGAVAYGRTRSKATPQLRANLARSDTEFGAGPNKQIFAENRNCGHSCPACHLAEHWKLLQSGKCCLVFQQSY